MPQKRFLRQFSNNSFKVFLAGSVKDFEFTKKLSLVSHHLIFMFPPKGFCLKPLSAGATKIIENHRVESLLLYLFFNVSHDKKNIARFIFFQK